MNVIHRSDSNGRPHAFRAASEYIEKLRDPRRRKYAREFYGFLRARGREPYPPNPANLTTMAAQAVRMELLDIMEPAGYGLPEAETTSPAFAIDSETP